MFTHLIIQVLAEEHAKRLIDEIFSEEQSLVVKLVRGNVSGTFGVVIQFSKWYESKKAVPEFLFGDKVEEITGMKPSELCYYEILRSGLDFVPFYELFPEAGYYKFGQEFQFSPSNGKIYYKGNEVYEVRNIDRIRGWIYKNPDPNMIINGLSKLWRRGFILPYYDLLTYESWRVQLGNILVY